MLKTIISLTVLSTFSIGMIDTIHKDHFKDYPLIEIKDINSIKENTSIQNNDITESLSIDDVIYNLDYLYTYKKLRSEYRLSHERTKRFSEWIVDAYYHVNKEVDISKIASVIMTESSFRYQATSSVGAVGPMQVRPVFWEEYCGFSNLEDPADNIKCGTMVLLKYNKENCNNDWTCTFQTYNVGPSNYRLKEYEPAKERYIAKINNNMW